MVDSNLYKKLKTFNISSSEIILLNKQIQELIFNNCFSLKSEEKEIIKFYLDYGCNVPHLLEEQSLQKKAYATARKELLKTGNDKQRLKGALKYFGLELKVLKKKNVSNLLSTFKAINEKTKELHFNKKRELSYSVMSSEYQLKWKTEAQRKKEVIRALHCFYKDYFSSERSIVECLRRNKIKDLATF